MTLNEHGRFVRTGAVFYGQICFYAANHERKTVASAYYQTRQKAEDWLRISLENIHAPVDEANIVEKWLSE